LTSPLKDDKLSHPMRKLLLTTALLLALSAAPAPALVLWGLDNTANLTDPGTGAPWNAVAKVTNSDGSLIEGSAVYLGNGFMLTANHVTMNLTYSFVTFDQVETFAIDPTFNDGVRAYGKQVAPGVDMAVFKLTSIPVSVTAATLLPTANAERVGASPIEPVIPFRTMSQGRAAISTEELSPSMTWIPFTGAAGAMLPTIGTLNFFACIISNSGFFRPALSPTIRN
jgi:hypothetical protein